MERSDKNAFVVTRVGQIRNVHNYIQQFPSERNVIILMYTSRDRTLLSNMQRICKKQLFDEIVYLQLPKKPVRLTPGKGKTIYQDMSRIMNRLKAQYDINQLFLCNINNYYVYFDRINSNEGLGMKINLLEEGLTTYKITSKDVFEVPEKKVNFSDVKKSGSKLVKSIKSFGKNAVKILVNTGVLFLQILSFLFKKNLVDQIMKAASKLLVRKKYQYGFIEKLDKAYLCFPDMAKESLLDINEVEKLEFRFSPTEDAGVTEQMKGYTNLFINQKYVNYDSHFRVIFRIFREMGLDNVLIKIHPKENLTDIVRKVELMRDDYPEIKVRILGDIGQVPVEDLVKNSSLDKVIGLTSSALIYLRTYLPEIKIISAAGRYYSLCQSQEKVPFRELAQFRDEYRFFLQFDGIRQFEAGGGEQ